MGKVWIKAPKRIRNSISGRLALFGTNSPTRQNAWACEWPCKRRAIPRAPALSVGIAARAVHEGGCLGARTRRASGKGTVMQWELRIFELSIVTNLVAATSFGPCHPPPGEAT